MEPTTAHRERPVSDRTTARRKAGQAPRIKGRRRDYLGRMERLGRAYEDLPESGRTSLALAEKTGFSRRAVYRMAEEMGLMLDRTASDDGSSINK